MNEQADKKRQELSDTIREQVALADQSVSIKGVTIAIVALINQMKFVALELYEIRKELERFRKTNDE